jgi:hypothetical protein
METVESVSRWAEETFGPCTPQAALERAFEEMDELDYAGEHSFGKHRKLVEEAADVCITLYRYIYLVDPEAINKKMVVNRKRKWKLNGDGTAQHVSSKEEIAADLMDQVPTQEERETNP